VSTSSRWFAVFAFVAASVTVACAPPIRPEPMSAAFRPAPGKADLWLTTPIAIEVENEHDARALEAAECDYIGEIDVRGVTVKRGDMALVAAQYGATHYRPVASPETERTSILLYRIERGRWAWLPDALRPAPPAL
jgi:hypothetical protein